MLHKQDITVESSLIYSTMMYKISYVKFLLLTYVTDNKGASLIVRFDLMEYMATIILRKNYTKVTDSAFPNALLDVTIDVLIKSMLTTEVDIDLDINHNNSMVVRFENRTITFSI